MMDRNIGASDFLKRSSLITRSTDAILAEAGARIKPLESAVVEIKKRFPRGEIGKICDTALTRKLTNND